MNRTLKTAGVSLALLTACLSANTVFADGQDKADISCSLSFKGDSTNIGWDAPQNDQITSYKLNVDLYSYTTASYYLTLDFNKCTYKLKKQK